VRGGTCGSGTQSSAFGRAREVRRLAGAIALGVTAACSDGGLGPSADSGAVRLDFDGISGDALVLTEGLSRGFVVRALDAAGDELPGVGIEAVSSNPAVVTAVQTTPAAGAVLGGTGFTLHASGVGSATVTFAARGSATSRILAVTVVAAPEPVAPRLSLSLASVAFSSEGSDPAPQTFTIVNTGGGTLRWAVAEDADWLSVTPESGVQTGIVTLSVDVGDLSPGTYAATVTVTGTDAAGQPVTPKTVAVVLTVAQPPSEPFGTLLVHVRISNPPASLILVFIGIDGREVGFAAGNGTLTFRLPVGRHTVSASRPGPNCSLLGDFQRSVEVPPGGTVQTTFQFGC
jgi:hypothetical protein